MNIQNIVLEYNGKTEILATNKTTFLDDLYVDVYYKAEENGQRLSVSLHPKKPIVVEGLRVVFTTNAPANARVFCNGWQSWTETREFELTETMYPLRRLARPLLAAMGDYSFYKYPERRGQLHSWSYTYWRKAADKIMFCGSLNEEMCFTVLEWNADAKTLTARKDLQDLELQHSMPLLDIWWAEGDEQILVDTFFALNNTKLTTAPAPINGWTSWYYHYTKISEATIKENLDAFAQQKNEVPPLANKPNSRAVFQIDDGWQTAVGDWLSVKTTQFPNGIDALADAIRAADMTAGLWLAPFICSSDSVIFKTKKDWLLTNSKGKPVVAGYNPLWSGWFYALDFYNLEVQNYLRQVLQVVQYKWGFALLKLDFLYAACLQPPPNKTRGQVMHEAMDFLRSVIPAPNQILACGVPIAAAFGRVDYCRIGADVHLAWEHKLLQLINGRERVSTILSLQNTIARHHLNGRAFHNDPDVILLRNDKTKLTTTQKNTLWLINTLLGGVVFTSDNVMQYNAPVQAQYALLDWAQTRVIQRVQSETEFCTINFTINEQDFTAYCNLSAKRKHVFAGTKTLHLAPYETIVVG